MSKGPVPCHTKRNHFHAMPKGHNNYINKLKCCRFKQLHTSDTINKAGTQYYQNMWEFKRFPIEEDVEKQFLQQCFCSN